MASLSASDIKKMVDCVISKKVAASAKNLDKLLIDAKKVKRAHDTVKENEEKKRVPYPIKVKLRDGSYMLEYMTRGVQNLVKRFGRDVSNQCWAEACEEVANLLLMYLDAYNLEHNKQSKSLPTTPMLVRKLVYLLVYARYYFNCNLGNNGVLRRSSFNQDVINEVNKACEAINKNNGYNLHIHRKSFTADKWGMNAYEDLKIINSIIDLPLRYEGRKDSTYGVMINRLVDEHEHTVFADIFGGSGQAFVSTIKKNGVDEYLNDSDIRICTFYTEVESNINDLMSKCRKLKKKINKIVTQEDEDKFVASLNSLRVSNSAFSFLVEHYFFFRGFKKSRVANFKTDDFKWLRRYSKRLRNVNLLNIDAVQLLTDPRINRGDALVYLDSPYIAAKGYKQSFTKNDMIDLLNNLKMFKGDFIFSCRPALHRMRNGASILKDSEERKDAKDQKEILWLLQEFMKFDRDLYVLFDIGNNDNDLASIERMVVNIIGGKQANNVILEIMITSFEFEDPDYAIVGALKTGFLGTNYVKKKYGEFLKIAEKVL